MEVKIDRKELYIKSIRDVVINRTVVKIDSNELPNMTSAKRTKVRVPPDIP